MALLGATPRDQRATDTIAVSAATSASEKAARWEAAAALLEGGCHQDLEPDVTLQNALVSACEKGQQWIWSLGVLRGMQLRGPGPDVISCNAGMQSWTLVCNLGRREEVELVSCNALVTACEKGRRWAPALIAFETVATLGLEADTITHDAAISALQTAGR